MLAVLHDLPHDPDRTVLHRALRVALVMPALFALGLHWQANPQFALFAAIGSFSTMAMADFVGPHRSRFVADLVLMLLGNAMIVIGTVLSNTQWQAVVAMLVIGVVRQFSAALGGQFALGNNSAILIFVLSVMVPAGDDAIPNRLGGWFLACACAAIATALLRPRNERRDLYLRLVEAVRALAANARTSAAGDRPGSSIGDLPQMRVEPGIFAFVLPGRGDLPCRIGEDGTEPRLNSDGVAKGASDGIDSSLRGIGP